MNTEVDGTEKQRRQFSFYLALALDIHFGVFFRKYTNKHDLLGVTINHTGVL